MTDDVPSRTVPAKTAPLMVDAEQVSKSFEIQPRAQGHHARGGARRGAVHRRAHPVRASPPFSGASTISRPWTPGVCGSTECSWATARRATSCTSCAPRRPRASAATSAWCSSASTCSRHMTALENVIEAPMRVKRMSRADAVARAQELLARVGLADKAGSYPSPPQRRPAAARRHRASARHGPQAHAVRRADLGARPPSWSVRCST